MPQHRHNEMGPDRIPGIIKDLEKLTEDTNKRHEENESRFDKLEIKITEIATEVKIIVALIVANGLLNIAHFFFGMK